MEVLVLLGLIIFILQLWIIIGQLNKLIAQQEAKRANQDEPRY